MGKHILFIIDKCHLLFVDLYAIMKNKEVIVMKSEELIVEMHGMLEKIMTTQEEHSQILQTHSVLLQEHGVLLQEHSVILQEHSVLLQEHSAILQEYSQILENHSSQLKEHGQILTALRSGQEHLKAEIDGMKISNAKEFGAWKEKNDSLSINQELLRNESWAQKIDIERIKKTMGMA